MEKTPIFFGALTTEPTVRYFDGTKVTEPSEIDNLAGHLEERAQSIARLPGRLAEMRSRRDTASNRFLEWFRSGRHLPEVEYPSSHVEFVAQPPNSGEQPKLYDWATEGLGDMPLSAHNGSILKSGEQPKPYDWETDNEVDLNNGEDTPYPGLN